MKKYEFLIFDLDDTLLDFQDTELKSLEMIFKKYAIPFENQYIEQYKVINRSLWDQLEQGLISKKQVLEQRFERFFQCYGIQVHGVSVEKEYRCFLNLGHKLIPEALEVLTTLKERGYKVFAGTNGVGETQRKRLHDANLLSLFDDIFISEEIGFEKPDVNFFGAISSKYPMLTKGNAIMIGDSLSSDIQGATYFGIDSVWFHPHGEHISAIEPSYEIKELSELLYILNKEGSDND